jgi:ferritin-like metal-binding protein YciE
VLPALERQATSEWLVDVLRAHLAETKEHAARLERVFRAAGAEPSSNLAAPVQKLAEHHDELAGSIASERLSDAYHAIAAATTEHYELAAYEALLALAQTLELDGDAVALLAQNRDEDANALVALHGSLQKLLGAT